MNIIENAYNPSLWKKLSLLKKSVDKSRNKALKKRLSSKPQATKLEYLLGAFMEMYEPHLQEFVHKFAQKGYAIDALSGFGGKNSELQIITGDFSTNYILHNKLEKIGIKCREYNGFKSLAFWPQKATLDHIKSKWMEIIDILPEKGILTIPSTSFDSVAFRRKYTPEDQDSQKQRLFDKLKYKIQRKVEADLKKRIKANPYPNKSELILGLFIEELEPQVKRAALKFIRKGYSPDQSGFMENTSDQMIEGDFQFSEDTIDKLRGLGVIVECNPSRYTRLQFTSEDADLSKLTKKWNKISSLLPQTNKQAQLSMTRRARSFRVKYG